MSTVTHNFVSAIPDDPAAAAAGEVLPSHWNASHKITGTPNKLAGYDASGNFADITVGTNLSLSGNTLTASGGSSGVTFTDGTNTVSAATQLTVTGGAVGGVSPNATLTVVTPVNTTATSHNFFTAYNSTTGAFTKAQPASTDLSDVATLATLTGTQALTNKDLTGAGNTFPTFNQNTTGSAAKWTTPRLLAGNSVDGSANVPFANKFIVQGTTDTGLTNAQFMGALSTGLVKNTTTTGVQSIAVSGTDYAPATTGSSILKASSGGFANAVAGTDYQAPITLTTTGTSGAATFVSNTLNIPQYATGTTINTLQIDQTPAAGTYGTLAGTVNGSNTVFTVSNSAYVSGSLMVFLNGQDQTQGSSNDWTETSPAAGTFTFAVAPPTGSIIQVVYIKTATTTGTGNAPVILATVAGIDGKAVANTTLYTVPTGKTAIILAYIVRCTAASAISSGSSAGIGNVAGTNNISASQSMTALTSTTATFQWSINGISLATAATGVIYYNQGTGATGTSQTLAIDLIGYTL